MTSQFRREGSYTNRGEGKSLKGFQSKFNAGNTTTLNVPEIYFT
jgi:hypothetical protein